jgi:hypothetical protein
MGTKEIPHRVGGSRRCGPTVGILHLFRNVAVLQKPKPEFVLIYGRQKEFPGKPDLSWLLSQFDQEDQVMMTFDHVKPLSNCGGCFAAPKIDHRGENGIWSRSD